MAELDAIEVTRQLTKHREEIESLKHRMDNVEVLTTEIHNMATALEVLGVEAKTTGEKVEAMSKKIEKLESKPGEKAEKLKDSAMASLVNILLGALLGAVLALIIREV